MENGAFALYILPGAAEASSSGEALSQGIAALKTEAWGLRADQRRIASLSLAQLRSVAPSRAAASYASSIARDANASDDEKRLAFKRAIELDSSAVKTWLEWASFERRCGDYRRALDLNLRAIDQTDAEWALAKVGREITTTLTDFKEFIPLTRRSTYTSIVIERLRYHYDELSANSLCTLAWLYLLTGETHEAEKVVEDGLDRFSNNPALKQLQSRLVGNARR